jgi:hypothetical protein
MVFFLLLLFLKNTWFVHDADVTVECGTNLSGRFGDSNTLLGSGADVIYRLAVDSSSLLFTGQCTSDVEYAMVMYDSSFSNIVKIGYDRTCPNGATTEFLIDFAAVSSILKFLHCSGPGNHF